MLCFEHYEHLRGEVNKVQQKKAPKSGALLVTRPCFITFRVGEIPTGSMQGFQGCAHFLGKKNAYSAHFLSSAMH